jgi:hypothetical protein
MAGIFGSGGRFQAPRGGRGRMGGPLAAGPGGICKCPKCNYTKPHLTGVPCFEQSCPQCGTKLTRG